MVENPSITIPLLESQDTDLQFELIKANEAVRRYHGKPLMNLAVTSRQLQHFTGNKKLKEQSGKRGSSPIPLPPDHKLNFVVVFEAIPWLRIIVIDPPMEMPATVEGDTVFVLK